MTDIDFNIRMKGGDKARQDLAGLANAVDKEAEKLSKNAEKRGGKQSEFERAFDRAMFGGKELGRALGSLPQRAFQNFNSAIGQAFDPNLSPAEKQLNLAKSTLDLVPFQGGEIPKALLDATTQEIIGGARGTGARINQILGPAFQASADLSDEEFARKFQPIIDKLREVIEPQERSRERGSELVAKSLTSFLEEFEKQKDETLSKSTDSLTASNKVLGEKIGELTKAISSPTPRGQVTPGTPFGKVD
jgi:hypothetical protein